MITTKKLPKLQSCQLVGQSNALFYCKGLPLALEIFIKVTLWSPPKWLQDMGIAPTLFKTKYSTDAVFKHAYLKYDFKLTKHKHVWASLLISLQLSTDMDDQSTGSLNILMKIIVIKIEGWH